jgi:hypothetical protein
LIKYGSYNQGVDADLAELTMTAAVTLIRQLTTDGWQLARSAMVAMWRMFMPAHASTVEAQLTDARTAALNARQAGDEHGEADLVSLWGGRLLSLVAADPAVVAELRRLLAVWDPEPRPAAAGGPRVDARVRASGSSRVIVAGQDVYVRER